MRRLYAVLALFGLLAGLLTAPAVSAAPTLVTAQNATAEQRAMVAAVPVAANQVVAYEHSGWRGEIYRSDVAGGCLLEKRYTPSAYVALRMSSVLLWVPTGNTLCNYLYVTNGFGKTWGTCVNQHTWGYSFGPDFNDNTWIIGVKAVSLSQCPRWSA